MKSRKAWFEGITPKLALHYLCLSVMYCINNQLAFACHVFADPGTYSVFKSAAPYLVAIFLRLLGDGMNRLQWIAIILLCISIMSTQYDDSGGKTRMSTGAYAMLAIHVTITATCSVWNQKVLKGSPVPINLQNVLLYSYGIVLSLLSYVWLEQPLNKMAAEAGRHGHDGERDSAARRAPALRVRRSTRKDSLKAHPLALALMLSQAFHGLAVSFVYKYADAIVKSFASSATMALLVILSSYLFHVELSFHSITGVASILVITFMYMNIAIKLPKPDVDSPYQLINRILFKSRLIGAQDAVELMQGEQSADATQRRRRRCTIAAVSTVLTFAIGVAVAVWLLANGSSGSRGEHADSILYPAGSHVR